MAVKIALHGIIPHNFRRNILNMYSHWYKCDWRYCSCPRTSIL